jgi:hypothetical protein
VLGPEQHLDAIEAGKVRATEKIGVGDVLGVQAHAIDHEKRQIGVCTAKEDRALRADRTAVHDDDTRCLRQGGAHIGDLLVL